MFAKPKTVQTIAPTATKKTKESAADQVAGFEEVAAIDACIKALDGLKKLKAGILQSKLRAQLVAEGLRTKGKPESRKLAEGLATGAYYLRKRDTRSPLSGEELDLLSTVGKTVCDDSGAIVEIEGYTTTVPVQPAMLAVNPAYAEDTSLLEKLDEAVKQAKIKLPDDFIIQQPAVVKIVVADEAIENLFRRSKADQVEACLDMLASITTRPVFPDLQKAWEIVQPLLEIGELSAEDKKRASADLTEALRASLAAEEAASVTPISAGKTRGKRAAA